MLSSMIYSYSSTEMPPASLTTCSYITGQHGMICLVDMSITTFHKSLLHNHEPYSETLGNNYRSSYLAAVVVGLEEVRYGDLENVGTIKVCAAIISPSGNCSVSFTFILYFNTTDDSARMYTTHHETRIDVLFILFPLESPADFSAIRNERLIFAPNQRRSCVDVRIQDDDVLEQTEAFTISLTGPDNLDERVSLVQTEGTVNIINDDGRLTACGLLFFGQLLLSTFFSNLQWL